MQQYTIHIETSGEVGCAEKVSISPGQNQLKEKIFRITTFGYADKNAVRTAISAQEFVLRDLDSSLKLVQALEDLRGLKKVIKK